MSAHVVQELENGRLSLRHQGLHPGNMDQFADKLNAGDRNLVTLLAKLNLQVILKKFAPKAKNPMDFFLNGFKDESKVTILNYTNRIMVEAIPLLMGRESFTMGNDGYPARKPLKLVDDKASILFHFERKAVLTQYYPEIYLRNEKVRLVLKDDVEILTNSPAWMLADGEIFTFDQEVEGKKLIPFLKKERISISRQMEETYFRKFVPQIIEKYRVEARGFEILHIDAPAQFRLDVDGSDENAISLKLRVRYGRELMPLMPNKSVRAMFKKINNQYVFYRVKRDMAGEREMLHLMDQLGEHDTLTSWEYMDRQKGLRWLAGNVKALREYGVEVRQRAAQTTIHFERPEIEISTKEEGDWFDVRAVVNIGGFSLPFIRFKGHILRGKHEYVLPDGSVTILPDAWFTDYRHLLEIAEEKGETLTVRRYQAAVLDMSYGVSEVAEKVGQLAADTKVETLAIPVGLKAELRDYQRKGYDWLGFLQENGFGGILADDMGLGKTLQTLCLLQGEKEKKVGPPSLVIMPTSLVYNWMSEAQRFTPDLRILVHTGSSRAKDPSTFSAYDLVITTYGLARQDLEMLKTFPFHYIILDESQMIKNASSKTAKAICELLATHRLSLTGTPLENTLLDLWSQMNFLNPGLLGTEAFFKAFYAQPIEKYQDKQRMQQLRKLIHPFILRRTKEQVATELPPKVEQVHYCEMTKVQKTIYDETKNAYRNYLLEMGVGEFKKKKLNVLAGLQKLRQVAIHPGLVEEGSETTLRDSGKFKEFERLLEQVLAKGAKVLIFSQFVRLLKMFKKELEDREIKYCYLDGGTRNRAEQVNRFQNDKEVSAFLISLKAGGVGLNLTAAEYVFILDPWWNPAVEAQAIDRSHRIGQVNTVFSYKFITQGTIEEKIVKLQARKSKLSSSIVSAEEDVFKNLDLEDIQDLIS